MSQESVSVNVNSSWVTNNQKDLKDAVTIVPLSSAKRGEDGSLTDMVEVDSCVHLTPPKEENGNQDTTIQPCSITINLESPLPLAIANVIVVSEARVIEVYGTLSEYLTTVQANLLDEVDGTAVFCADIKLNQLTRECTLKFARLSRTSDMWLYGVKVIWRSEDTTRRNRPKSGLNFESVEQRLKESHTPLSDRAESCKRFLKMYSSLNEQKKSLEGFPDPVSLLSLLPAISKQKQTTSIDRSHLESVMENYSSAVHTSRSSPASGDGHTHEDNKHPVCDQCLQKFESVIEKRIVSMENRIMRALDEKITSLQQHQDKQFQNLFCHLLDKGDPASARVKAGTERTDLTLSDQNLKIEHAIKQMLDQKNGSSYGKSSRTNACEDTNDSSVLRNALMVLQISESFSGAPCQNGIDSSSSPLVQNLS